MSSGHGEPEPEPPWQRHPDAEPWWSGWRQGNAEPWYLGVFLPFWTELSDEGRARYLERWPPPNQRWADRLAEYAASGLRRVPFADAPVPPWVRHPNVSPLFFGRFGHSKTWLRSNFLPFWTSLSTEEREAYLDVWQPPSEAWRNKLSKYLVGD